MEWFKREDPPARPRVTDARAKQRNADIDSGTSGKRVRKNLHQQHDDVIKRCSGMGEAAFVVAVDRNDTADPAAIRNHGISEWHAEARNRTGDASDQIASEIQHCSAEGVPHVELRKGAGLLRVADQFVSMSESKMVLRVNHEHSEQDGEQVSRSDGDYRQAGAG